MVNIEKNIEALTRIYKNIYIVGIFSTGRRVYDPDKHCKMLKIDEALAEK